MEYINRLNEKWQEIGKHGDPRTTDWFLMSSPLPTALICLGYVYIVKVLGPKLMENRKPFKLRKVLIFYNFFQVIFSAWLFYEACQAGWFPVGQSREIYNYRCQALETGDEGIRMAHGSWWYFFSKFTEFFDTFFFVMRKRYDQVSTLHVIHHGIMPFSVWWGVKFMPGGHSTFFGFFNTGVHIIMYFYYMLAAMGPQYQKYLWWKKYLTVFQMVQFVTVMIHAFQLLVSNPCGVPMSFVWLIALHALMFFFLFKNFFDQAYKEKKARDELRLKEKKLEALNNTGKTPIYESMGKSIEESYELRNRVFVGSKN